MKPVFILFSLCFFLTNGKCEAQLSAGFTSNIVNGCSPIVVNFSDQSTGNPSEWRWDLGNGTISTLQNPSATYFNPGFYTIKLWIRSGNSTDSVIRTNYINVFSSPVVDFSSDVSTGCNPFVVNFSGRETLDAGNIISTQWDFGDGILSGEQNPQHIYTLAGTYNVALKAVSNDGCTTTIRKTSYIKNGYVKAAFINWRANSCATNKILFQNESSSSGTLIYHWDFGDGTFSSSITPQHIYANAGIYTLKLIVRNETGCIDSASKNIIITPPVTASFTCDKTFSCVAPATVHFTNQTAANATYYWDFGDGTSSTIANPAHSYWNAGIYSVKFVIKNNSGCADSLLIHNYIDVRKTLVNTSLPDSGCVPFTKHFSASTDPRDSITGLLWKIGNETIPEGLSPMYTFTVTGSYDVSLITTAANGCVDTTKIPQAITIGEKPIARFSADIFNTCASTNINFTDLSIGNITYREWQFGDRGTSYEKNPSHFYKDTGWMTVKLIVSSAGCIDSAVYTRYIYIKAPIAKFKTGVDCNHPYRRSFVNLSIGAQRWLWDFGDGDTSNEFEPVHIFRNTGNFPVTLKVWNDETGCSYTFITRMKIADVRGGFSATDTNVCRKQNVFFNAQSHPDITHYYWQFGDNTYFDSTGTRAIHAYELPGTYSVELLVLDSSGCLNSILKRDYLIVTGPTAGFYAPVTDACVNTPVSFGDNSYGDSSAPLKSWEWNYGDGTIDTLFAPPFFHIYPVTGSYTVFLKVTDSTGCTDAAWLPQPISVGRLSSSFSISDSIACPGYSLRFTCPFASSNTNYLWDFGDGATSTLQRPYHSYINEGIYSVKLYVSKTNGCIDSTVLRNAVKIKQTEAAFAMSDSVISCPPLLVRFTNNSTGALSEYWNFGDSSYSNTADPSHYYVYPGKYKAILYAKGHAGCVDTIQKTIVIKGPMGRIDSDLSHSCKPYEYHFTAHTENAVSYVWDFDDGVTQSGNDSLVNHIYSDPGNFVPKIILEDIAGCRVPVSSKDTLKNIFVHPGFTFPDSILCGNEDILFTNSSVSNDSMVSFAWNFGDSIISVQKNIVRRYNLPGIYHPSLEVTTAAGCSNKYTSVSPVKVASLPSISMFTTGSGCAPLQVAFNTFSTSADSSTIKWKWNMGNGDTSALQIPPAQTYPDPGDYTVSVSAVNAEGCSSTIQDTLQVFGGPQTNISGDSFLCRGNSINFKANGAKKYVWLSSVNVSCDTCINITTTPVTTTQYILTGISEQGCVSNDTLNVNVYQPIQLQYRPSANICIGQSTKLNINGANLYTWLPPYGLSSTVSSNPVASPDTTTDYTIIGYDMKGCFKDTARVRVNVFKDPFVKACEDKIITAGTPVTLGATYSGDVTEVYWYPNDNISRYDPNSVIVKPTENTEYTVKVKNGAGCAATDKVTVFVTCNENNVFVPNLFSPNNDGINDVFYPRGTGLLKIQTLRIFNRWGEIVFEKKSFNANDPSAGWDGTYKGSKLISDVFVYRMDLICENSSILSLNGNISLVK